MKYKNLLSTSKIIDLLKKQLNVIFHQKGKNLFFLCFFHKDKNPSLSFNSEKGYFKCYSCDFFANNIFDFWAKYKKNGNEISPEEFTQSLREISKLGYFNFFEEENEEKIDDKIGNTLQLVSNIYQNNLSTNLGRKIFNYIKKERSLDDKTIKNFSLGCSIIDKQITKIFFSQENKIYFEKSLLIGVVKIDEENKAYDFFKPENLIIPLKDEKGKIVAFSSRNILKQKEKKYLFLANYQNYRKSSFLYNYYAVKQSREEECFLVEGFFDVMSLWKKKIKNCLAILGTDCSPFQILLLQKLKKKIVIFLDGDEAGKEATIKITISLLMKKIDCEIINYTYHNDPDKICLDYDEENIFKILKIRQNPFLFILDFFSKKFELKESPQRTSFFISKIAEIFKKFERDVKSFLIEKISNSISWKKNEIEFFFHDFSFPTLHINYFLEKNILELEQKLVNFCSKSREFWMIIFIRKFFFFNPIMSDKYIKIHNYYISSPYNNPILKNREEEKESKYLEEEYLLILEKTNIIRLFFSFIND